MTKTITGRYKNWNYVTVQGAYFLTTPDGLVPFSPNELTTVKKLIEQRNHEVNNLLQIIVNSKYKGRSNLEDNRTW